MSNQESQIHSTGANTQPETAEHASIENAAAPIAVATDDMADADNTKAADSKPERLGVLTAPLKNDRTKPTGLVNFIYDVQDAVNVGRFHTIRALPGFVVNNSSNAIGLVQLVGEALMFKSGGFDLIDAKNKGKPLHWIIDPPKNVLNAVFKKAMFKGKFTDMFKWSSLKAGTIDFFDLKKATLLDKIDEAGQVQKLTNRWSARSGFMGITAMTIASILPEAKEKPEEIEHNVVMAKTNPIGYYGERLGQALLFPLDTVRRIGMKAIQPGQDQGIGTHKTQFSGLGMTLAGLFSFISGFRQVEGKIIGQQHYMRNYWQMAGGVITFFGGSSLMLGVNNQQGWTNYGAVQILRLGTLGPSIFNRFKPGPNGKPEQGAEWYLGAQGALQFKNFFALLIGGAKKLPDGTLIDTKAARMQAVAKADEIKARRKEIKAGSHTNDNDVVTHTNDNELVPSTKVSHASAVHRAMPEREAAQETAIA